ncbi:MAG: lipopolysaccharide export system permease protein [Gemmatimonadales bacterium]|nr:lipopolysaccharide export system permease protein [Gemmatimonadales bacterium]
MRLLNRYILRQLTAPFFFALAAQTSLMLLSQVAKKFGALVGKGLPWTVIGEVFLLSLPFIIAMTLPMAVLLAVLYTFSHLAADNEITATKASGISVYQVLTPVLLWGVCMAALNFAFVDQVLPRTNARLRSLLIDIGRKKPTFELREQVINEVPPSQYFLRASRIDAATGRLRGVTIYDVGGESSRRIIYADSGAMAYAEGQTDLSLRLYDGAIHQYRPAEPARFQLTYFTVNDIRVKNVFDELQRNTSESVRGDREMSTCEMLTVIRDAREELAEARRERSELVLNDLRTLLGQPPLRAVPATPPDSSRRGYCGWLRSVLATLLPKTAEAQAAAQGVPPKLPPQSRPVMRPRVRLSSWSEVASATDRVRDADRRADRYAVEVHKKWAISLACISFVIVGIVMALRFPRAGIGLVIGGGLLVFSIHYVGLTAGESLADRGLVSPWVAMWTPNILLTVLGVLGLLKVSRESGSTRGGDFQELLDGLRHLLRRLLPPFRPLLPLVRWLTAGLQRRRGAIRRAGFLRLSGLRQLDRYVIESWVRIFVLTALGFPLVSILINLTDNLNRLLDRGLGMKEIAISYIYSIPENAFIVMPAAVLFATVFTVGAMGRHSELTAVKAGGQSFHRLMRPVFIAACAASALAFLVGELAPGATARQLEIQKARQARPTRTRFNFVYRGDKGWVYTIRSLDVTNRQLKQLMFERQGTGLSYPDLVLTADSASYDDKLKAWRLRNGASRVVVGPNRQATFTFRTMRLKALRQSPADLLAEPKAPDEMRYAELGRYIDALKRSGNDANKLLVDQALKLALPATCLIIALFGAPLAVTSPRAGAAVGVAISLGTTVIFLLFVQITKAIGAGGVINPLVAAWFPNVVFLFAGLVLLAKVRT